VTAPSGCPATAPRRRSGGRCYPRPAACTSPFTLPPRFDPDELWGTDDLALRERMFRASTDPGTHPVLDDPNPFGYGTVRGASALHATASVDCLMQLSGESVFVLPDTEIRLAPGDWMVVNGVPHSCRNDGDETAVLVGVVVGAHHDGVPRLAQLPR
jgi:hypothetical protein